MISLKSLKEERNQTTQETDRHNHQGTRQKCHVHQSTEPLRYINESFVSLMIPDSAARVSQCTLMTRRSFYYHFQPREKNVGF